MSAEGIKMAAECWLNLGFKVTIVADFCVFALRLDHMIHDVSLIIVRIKFIL